jgi:hypothetical protein
LDENLQQRGQTHTHIRPLSTTRDTTSHPSYPQKLHKREAQVGLCQTDGSREKVAAPILKTSPREEMHKTCPNRTFTAGPPLEGHRTLPKAASTSHQEKTNTKTLGHAGTELINTILPLPNLALHQCRCLTSLHLKLPSHLIAQHSGPPPRHSYALPRPARSTETTTFRGCRPDIPPLLLEL